MCIYSQELCIVIFQTGSFVSHPSTYCFMFFVTQITLLGQCFTQSCTKLVMQLGEKQLELERVNRYVDNPHTLWTTGLVYSPHFHLHAGVEFGMCLSSHVLHPVWLKWSVSSFWLKKDCTQCMFIHMFAPITEWPHMCHVLSFHTPHNTQLMGWYCCCLPKSCGGEVVPVAFRKSPLCWCWSFQ